MAHLPSAARLNLAMLGCQPMGGSRRPGLTRQTMIETALLLLDEVGLDGLTVRRLAAELGVQSPSLYWHIRTKQDWLTRRGRAYRRSLLAHRDSARIVAAAAALSPATVRAFDQELTAMVGCGFTPVLALRTIAALTRYVNGFVLQEQTERQGAAAPPADQLAALAGLLDGGTSATLLVAIREGGSSLSEEAFEYGVRALIDGTTSALARQ